MISHAPLSLLVFLSLTAGQPLVEPLTVFGPEAPLAKENPVGCLMLAVLPTPYCLNNCSGSAPNCEGSALGLQDQEGNTYWRCPYPCDDDDCRSVLIEYADPDLSPVLDCHEENCQSSCSPVPFGPGYTCACA